MRWIILLVAVFALGSCASISKEECLAGDWAGIGARDGAAGQVADAQFSRHIDACAKVAVTPDRAAWTRGYQAGLAQYCTPASGLREGLAGRRYGQVCPNPAGFLEAYDIGRSAYDQRQVVDGIDREISALQSRAFALAAATDPALIAERAASAREIRHLELMRLTEQARLWQAERAVATYRARMGL
jgi:hypothetical protein